MSTESHTVLPSISQSHQRMQTIGEYIVASVRGVSFWAAILLPFIALVALVGGLVSLPTIGGLVGMNVLCAVIGHDYA